MFSGDNHSKSTMYPRVIHRKCSSTGLDFGRNRGADDITSRSGRKGTLLWGLGVLFTVVGLVPSSTEVLSKQHDLSMQVFHATCRRGNNGGKWLPCLISSSSQLSTIAHEGKHGDVTKVCRAVDGYFTLW